MASCPGTSTVPTRIFKPLRRYPLRNGRWHFLSGYAECPNCHRTICTRPRKGDDEPIMVSHRVRTTVEDPRRNRLARRALRYGLNDVALGAFDFGTTQYVAFETTPYVALYTASSYEPVGYIANTTNAYATGGWVTLGNAEWTNWNTAWNTTATTSLNNDLNWERWANPAYEYVQARVRRSPEAPRLELEYRQREAEAAFRQVESQLQIDPAAAQRAREMLVALLNEEQRAEYAEHGYFHVVGSKGRLYRILRGSSGNIRRVRSRDDDSRGEAGFCVHLRQRIPVADAAELGLQPGHLPHEDHMIAQMLHLQADEEEILSQANVHWGTRWPIEERVPA